MPGNTPQTKQPEQTASGFAFKSVEFPYNSVPSDTHISLSLQTARRDEFGGANEVTAGSSAADELDKPTRTLQNADTVLPSQPADIVQVDTAEGNKKSQSEETGTKGTGAKNTI